MKIPDAEKVGSAKRAYLWICCGCTFQLLCICILLVTVNLHDPMLFGLSFLEVEPKHFECRSVDADTGEEKWAPCSKDEICGSALPKEDYRPVKDDPEYLDNWVDKFDLLCTEKYKVGLLGSMFFAGIVTGMLFVPALADNLGRKWVFISSLSVAQFGQMGLMWTTNIYEAYVYMFLIGLAFAGRIIVGISYHIEFNLKENSGYIVTAVLLSEATGTLLITIWYQFIDRGWFLLQLVLLLTGFLVISYYIFLFPESPKWLYANQKYDDSRENLAYVANFNSLSERRVERIKRLQYDLEVLERIRQEKNE